MASFLLDYGSIEGWNHFVAFEVIHVSLKKVIVDKVIPLAFVFLH